MNPLYRFVDWLYTPWEARLFRLWGANRAILSAARIVATLAPADAVSAYIDECTRIQRQYQRWRDAITTGSGCMPGLMWAAGAALDTHYGWGIVAAQCAWCALWIGVGNPWMLASLEESTVGLTGAALERLLKQANPTQAQLNEAARRLGEPTEWTINNE